MFHPWRRFEHPQIGEIEIGGRSRREVAALARKDGENLFDAVTGYVRFLAGTLPEVRLTLTERSVGGKIHLVEAEIGNTGRLPTSGTEQYALMFPDRRPAVSVELEDSLSLLDGADSEEIDHIAPGRSLQRKWVVKGKGKITVRCVSEKFTTAEAQLLL